MDPARWIMMLALALFLCEGFMLSVFPTQFKQMLMDAEPNTLKVVGLTETILAAGLMAGIWLT